MTAHVRELVLGGSQPLAQLGMHLGDGAAIGFGLGDALLHVLEQPLGPVTFLAEAGQLPRVHIELMMEGRLGSGQLGDRGPLLRGALFQVLDLLEQRGGQQVGFGGHFGVRLLKAPNLLVRLLEQAPALQIADRRDGQPGGEPERDRDDQQAGFQRPAPMPGQTRAQPLDRRPGPPVQSHRARQVMSPRVSVVARTVLGALRQYQIPAAPP